MSSFIDKVKSIFTGKKKEELKPLLGVVHPSVPVGHGDACKCPVIGDPITVAEVKLAVEAKPEPEEPVSAPVKKPAAKKPATTPATAPAAKKPAAKKPAGPKGSKSA